MKTQSPYYNYIRLTLENIGREADPRHIEAYMRLQYSTLDHLSTKQFFMEVLTSLECIKVDGKENAENLAQSFAL